MAVWHGWAFWTKLLIMILWFIVSSHEQIRLCAILSFCCMRPKRVRTSVLVVPQIARGRYGEQWEELQHMELELETQAGPSGTWSAAWASWAVLCRTTAASAGGVHPLPSLKEIQRSHRSNCLKALHHILLPKPKGIKYFCGILQHGFASCAYTVTFPSHQIDVQPEHDFKCLNWLVYAWLILTDS